MKMPFAEPPMDIWRAAREGRLEELQRFIESGVEIDARDRGDATPLHEASSRGHLSVARWLLEHGANPNARTKPVQGEAQGTFPLHEAILHRHKDIAKLLLAHKAKVNAKMSDGCTPLILAVDGGRLDLVMLLLQSGGDISLCNEMGYTPFATAVLQKHFEIARLLLERGSDVNQRVEPFEVSLLMVAAMDKSVDSVRFLLDAGANVHVQDGRGQTVLHAAVLGSVVRVAVWDSREDHPRVTEDKPENAVLVLKELLCAGADPTIRDNEGMAPLDWARKTRVRPIIEILEQLQP